MNLTRVERWMLSNQCRILEGLYPKEKKYYEEIREALESGYEREYDRFVDHIYETTLSAAACTEVVDILSMYDNLQHAAKQLADRAGIDDDDLVFPGFDGNNETKQMSYAEYFCGSDGGRFVHLKREKEFNSHMPTLERYRAMLRELYLSRDRHNLTRDDIVRILAARP